MKKHNFNAGPSILPRIAIENSAKAILDLNGIGLSLLEISHRSKDFQAIIDEAMGLFKELLKIPAGYQVLFLGGGASKQGHGQRKRSRRRSSLVKSMLLHHRKIRTSVMCQKITPFRPTSTISILQPTIPFSALNFTKILTALYRLSQTCRQIFSAARLMSQNTHLFMAVPRRTSVLQG
jgi:hypothetical protein